MKYFRSRKSKEKEQTDAEKKLYILRKKVNDLHFRYGHSKNKIAQMERVSKKFVIRWTQSSTQDFTVDERGWEKGKGRRYSKADVDSVKLLHKSLTDNPKNYFFGASAVLQQWQMNYPQKAAPSLRTIGRIMKQEGLSKVRKPRTKGASAYLCYPEYTIYEEFGGRMLEADFIGKKYIDGRSTPLNFIGFSFKKSPRLRYYQRIESQTAECFIHQAGLFVNEFEKPDYIKVDNCLATIGSASGKRNLSQTMLFLFSKKIIPMFSVPRKPFTQASIEGNNSVFSRNFWNRTRFTSLSQIDTQLQWFNQSSLRYTAYQKPAASLPERSFTPKVYFLRQVGENQLKQGYINVLNENIRLKKALINYYVLAEWLLQEEVLNIYIEKEKKKILLKSLPFKINENSRKNLIKSGNLLFDL